MRWRSVLGLVGVTVAAAVLAGWQSAPGRPAAAAGTTVSITLPSLTFHLAPGPHVEEVEALCSTCPALRYTRIHPPLPGAVWAAGVDRMFHVSGAPTPRERVVDIVD